MLAFVLASVSVSDSQGELVVAGVALVVTVCTALQRPRWVFRGRFRPPSNGDFDYDDDALRRLEERVARLARRIGRLQRAFRDHLAGHAVVEDEGDGEAAND